MQQGSSATAGLTDEQILDMAPETGERNSAGVNGEAQASARSSVREATHLHEGASRDENATETEHKPSSTRDGDASRSSATGANGEHASADEPAWVAALDAQPAAAAEARRWHAAAKDVAAIDAAYFGADAATRAGLAARLYESDPGAFREMLAESARTLAARDPQALADLARQLGMPQENGLRDAVKSVSHAARAATLRDDAQASAWRTEQLNGNANKDLGGASSNGATPETNKHGAAFPAEAYRAFEVTANEDVGRQMQDAIDRALHSALPEGVAAGARRRIAADIFRDVHSSLSSDRELAKRVSDALRDWRFDAAARQQVVALVSGRARAVLPEVARRVVGEWTSSVLALDRAKTARTDAASSRRDITGGRLPETVPGSGRPRNVDYGRISDEQILEM